MGKPKPALFSRRCHWRGTYPSTDLMLSAFLHPFQGVAEALCRVIWLDNPISAAICNEIVKAGGTSRTTGPKNETDREELSQPRPTVDLLDPKFLADQRLTNSQPRGCPDACRRQTAGKVAPILAVRQHGVLG